LALSSSTGSKLFAFIVIIIVVYTVQVVKKKILCAFWNDTSINFDFISIAAATCGTAAALYSNYQRNIVSTSSSSSLLGTRTGRKQGQSCGVFSSCGDNLSCFTGGNSDYCVPNGKEGACCGGIFSDEAAGIDCLSGLICSGGGDGSVETCIPTCEGAWVYAKKGSCNVNTGERANECVEC